MDVNLRKTATDTAYIVVGVGVLGFQQAQVRRRDALARVATIQRDARGSLTTQTDKLKSRTDGCAANLTNKAATIGSTVSGSVGGTVTDAVGSVGSQVKAGVDIVGTQAKAGADLVGTQVGNVGSQVKAGADMVGSGVKAGADIVGTQVKAGADVVSSAVGNQVKAGADLMGSADPRGLIDPVVGDIRVRVEPVVEQLRTIALPGTVSALPDQVSKVIEVGRNRVQGRWGGSTTPTAVPNVANGSA